MNPIDRQTAIGLLDNLIGMVDDNHDSDYDSAEFERGKQDATS